MTRRQMERDLSKKIPVSFTMDKELHDFVEGLIDRRIFKDRTHAINSALDFLKWTLKNEPLKFYGPRSLPQNPQEPQRPQ